MGSWTRKFDPHTRLNDAIEKRTGTTVMRKFDPIRQAKDATHRAGDPYFDPPPPGARPLNYAPALNAARRKNESARGRVSIMSGGY